MSDRRMSDEVVKQVLTRAAELDARAGEGLSEEELRQAAHEAGISPGALTRALEETRVEHVRQQPPVAPAPAAPGRWWTRARTALTAAVTGGALAWPGMGMPMLDPTRPVTIGLAVMFAYSMLRASRDPDAREYQVSNAIIWGGFLIGHAAVSSFLLMDIAVVTGVAGVLTAGAGSLLRRILRRDGEPASVRVSEPA